MVIQIVFETHAATFDNERGIATGWRPGELSAQGRTQAVELGRRRSDQPFPGGQSYRQVVEGVSDLLSELRRTNEGQRILLVGHRATRMALDHLLGARPLTAALTESYAWQPGWDYVLDGPSPTAAGIVEPRLAQAFGGVRAGETSSR